MAGKIVNAAVMQNGKLYVGKRHGTIIQEMHKNGCPKVTQAMQGFVDAGGFFLSRKEAYYVAVYHKQIEDDGKTPCLLSEMVW